MEIHGKLNLVDSQVKSDEFASTNQFNKLVVNSLSQVDQSTLDHETIIFNKENDRIYTYNLATDGWISTDSEVNRLYDLEYFDSVAIDEVQDIYNEVHLDTENTQLSVDPDLFDFGPIGSPIDFVIDFWLKPKSNYCAGTLLYNGNNSGVVDIERSKNLLISTSHVDLVKDPIYQRPATHRGDVDRIFKLTVRRPNLVSISNIWSFYLVHVALIRSGEMTYLAINGKIEDSAPSEEYFHYDDVLIGNGYFGNVNYGMINLRVSKGTDRGWTTGFTPPNFNHTVDGNTDFLMDEATLTDATGNYVINEVGDPTVISQDRFYYEIPRNFNGNIITTNLDQDKLVLLLPTDNVDSFFRFKTTNTPFEVISLNDHSRYQSRQQAKLTLSTNVTYDYHQNSKDIIVEPNLGTTFRSNHQIRDIYGFQYGIVNIDNDTQLLQPDGSYAVISPFTNKTHDYRNSKLNNVQDFYCHVTGQHTGIRNAGTGLIMWDAVIKPAGNYWATLHGQYSDAHGWSFVGYSSSNHVVMRYYYRWSIRFRDYNAAHEYDYFHFIFAYYRRKIYAVSINLNKETEYTIVEQTTNADYTNFSGYMHAQTAPNLAFIRYRHINRELSDDDILGLIKMSYIK